MKKEQLHQKLKKRDDKLRDAMDEMEKRQLINDVNTVADVSLCKRITDSIVVARAYDFYNKLKEIDQRRRNIFKQRNELIRILIEKLTESNEDILRRILRKWNDKAQKIKDEAAKKRIAKWTEDTYRIANARKNWKKLVDLYEIYTNKRPLYEIRKRLIKYITLKDLRNKLKHKFQKEGNDQFKRGVDYQTILKYLRKLFGDIDDVNKILTLKYYLNKWNDKAKKLKKRDDKLMDALDEIEKRQLIKDVTTITDVSRTKKTRL